MPNIPDALCLDMQVQVFGQIGAGGSNTINTVNTMHYRRSATANPLNETSFLTAWLAAVQTVLLTAMNNRWTFLTANARCINDATDVGVVATVNLPGLVAGDGMTSINAAFLYFKAPLRGKFAKGGVHFGPLSESDTTGAPVDILNAAAITRWNNVGAAIKGPITDASPNIWTLETVSRKKSSLVVNPTMVVATPVGSVLLNKRVGRLRRREVKSVY